MVDGTREGVYFGKKLSKRMLYVSRMCPPPSTSSVRSRESQLRPIESGASEPLLSLDVGLNRATVYHPLDFIRVDARRWR